MKRVIIAGIPTDIREVDKAELGPLFGLAVVKKSGGKLRGIIKIRRVLNNTVKKFIEEHEKYHIKDCRNNNHWLIKETKANIAGAIKEPLGFVLTTAITIISSERRNYYIKKLFVRKMYK